MSASPSEGKSARLALACPRLQPPTHCKRPRSSALQLFLTQSFGNHPKYCQNSVCYRCHYQSTLCPLSLQGGGGGINIHCFRYLQLDHALHEFRSSHRPAEIYIKGYLFDDHQPLPHPKTVFYLIIPSLRWPQASVR